MLLDGRRIGSFIARRFPTHSEDDGREYVGRARTAVVDYVKAQVLLSAVMGASVGVAMWIQPGRRVPVRRAVRAVLRCLDRSHGGHPVPRPRAGRPSAHRRGRLRLAASALWVIITFVLIQQVEGHILVPVIMGSRFRVHPPAAIFAILAGGDIHGVTGMLIAIPLIPLVKETWLFFRPRLQFEGCAPPSPVAPRPKRAPPPPPRAAPRRTPHRPDPAPRRTPSRRPPCEDALARTTRGRRFRIAYARAVRQDREGDDVWIQGVPRAHPTLGRALATLLNVC